MRFSDAFLDEIRDRLPISKVVGAKVTFDRKKTNASKGDYWACCPFHGEKTPSFHCEDRKGRYYCFGCGASGDHFRFLTELEGISFPEAVERLASEAGVPMPVADPRQRERDKQRATLIDVMEMAAAFFQDQLQTAAGAKARAYLRDRGLSAQVQQTFRLGYALDSRNALKTFLADKGVEKKQIEACGLVVFGDDIAVSYDRFRDRVMFPIPDSRGRVIAFAGRAMSADNPAKYMNSPETELFHKSNVLYNYARARKPAHERGQVIAAEGYMDVIALHAAGFDNAVAPMGTALTERQMVLLWRLHTEPILCFDGDEAGLRAAERAIDMVLPGLQPGRSVRFAMLPAGQDPDDLLRASGADAMREVLDGAQPLIEMIWSRELRSGMHETPEHRAELESRLYATVRRIGDEAVRRHYVQAIRDRLEDFFGAAGHDRPTGSRSGDNRRQARRRAGGPGRVAASPSLMNSALVKKRADLPPMRETALVLSVVFHPAIAVACFDEFAGLQFDHPLIGRIHACVLDALANRHHDADDHVSREEVAQALENLGLGDQVAALETQLRRNGVWQALPEAAFEDAVDGWRQAYVLHLRNNHLNRELKAAAQALADDHSESNLERLVQIQAELERGEGTEALIEGFGVSSGRPEKAF